MYVPSMTNAQLLSQWARILVYFSLFAISIQLKSVADGFLLLLHSPPSWEIWLWGHFHLCLKAVSLYSQKNNSLFGVVCQHVQGQSGGKPLIWVCLLLFLTRSMTSGGIFCLKWAFIREFTGITVTSKKCTQGVKKSSFRSQIEETWPTGLLVIWSLFVYFVSIPNSRCWRENSEERKDIFLYSHYLQSRMA